MRDREQHSTDEVARPVRIGGCHAPATSQVVAVSLRPRGRPGARGGWHGPGVAGRGRTARGVQVLTAGPVHEAFAEPVVFDPRPGPVVPKEPAAADRGAPARPEARGADVQWIPGYWAWDDGRNDFLWVSGIWRDLPPGRQWVPGYWNRVQGGYPVGPRLLEPRRPGAADVPARRPRPASRRGRTAQPLRPTPSGRPAAGTGRSDRYVWRPGFWVPYQPDWVWVPAHYVWTPSGCLFVDGYWDRPIERRGLLFAPVYFQQPVYRQPNFVFIPTIVIAAAALTLDLFVRPSYNHYYFGDYYDRPPTRASRASTPGTGSSRAASATTRSTRTWPRSTGDDRAWEDQLRADYAYRTQHREARPPPRVRGTEERRHHEQEHQRHEH